MWTNIFLFLWIIGTIQHRSTSIKIDCATRVKMCPIDKDDWVQKNDQLKCATNYGYVCLRGWTGYLYESCIANFTIQAKIGNCPILYACFNNKPYLGAENTYYGCPKEVSGCPTKDHPEYSIHQLYKYPKCLESNFSDETENTSQRLTEFKSMTTISNGHITGNKNRHVVIVILTSALLFTFVGCFICYVLSRKKYHDHMKVATEESEDPPKDSTDVKNILSLINSYCTIYQPSDADTSSKAALNKRAFYNSSAQKLFVKENKATTVESEDPSEDNKAATEKSEDLSEDYRNVATEESEDPPEDVNNLLSLFNPICTIYQPSDADTFTKAALNKRAIYDCSSQKLFVKDNNNATEESEDPSEDNKAATEKSEDLSEEILYTRRKRYEDEKSKDLRCSVQSLNESDPEEDQILPLKGDDKRKEDRIHVPEEVRTVIKLRSTKSTDRQTLSNIKPDKTLNKRPGKESRDAGYRKTVIAKSWKAETSKEVNDIKEEKRRSDKVIKTKNTKNRSKKKIKRKQAKRL